MTDVGSTPRKPMTPARRLRIWEAGKGICILCDRKIDGVREEWTVEHKRALALGGEDTDENCGPAHEDCRREKDKDDLTMIAKAKRMKMRHLGIRRSRTPMMGSKRSGWKKPFNRPAERRT